MNIGFFGGSFNPPSNIHINIAKEVIKKFNLDKVIFVPVGNYYKKSELIEAKHRFNMLKLAIETEKNLAIDDVAVNSKDMLYAIDTFKLLKEKYKDNNLFFVMGSDNFRKMPKWKDYDELISKFNIIVIERDRKKVREQLRKNILEFIPEKLSKVDSTKIREMIRKGNLEDNLLNTNVYKYIKDNNLYKS